MGDRIIKEGKGWRLGWDANKPDYPGLVAGEQWAAELTAEEFQDFCRLAQQLANTLHQMQNHLMQEERIACEAETSRLWLEVEGFPTEFTLHLIVLTGRSCEGEWSTEATNELIAAIPSLAVF